MSKYRWRRLAALVAVGFAAALLFSGVATAQSEPVGDQGARTVVGAAVDAPRSASGDSTVEPNGCTRPGGCCNVAPPSGPEGASQGDVWRIAGQGCEPDPDPPSGCWWDTRPTTPSTDSIKSIILSYASVQCAVYMHNISILVTLNKIVGGQFVEVASTAAAQCDLGRRVVIMETATA